MKVTGDVLSSDIVGKRESSFHRPKTALSVMVLLGMADHLRDLVLMIEPEGPKAEVNKNTRINVFQCMNVLEVESASTIGWGARSEIIG